MSAPYGPSLLIVTWWDPFVDMLGEDCGIARVGLFGLVPRGPIA